MKKIGKVQNRDIIVFHLQNKETIEALEEIIPFLRREEFQFKTLSQL